MQYVIIGKDGRDEQAIARRLAVRKDHMDYATKLQEEGKMLYALALLEDNKMVGSIMVMDFLTENDLEEYLQNEPYVKGKVWQDIEIKHCQVGALFAAEKIS